MLSFFFLILDFSYYILYYDKGLKVQQRQKKLAFLLVPQRSKNWVGIKKELSGVALFLFLCYHLVASYKYFSKLKTKKISTHKRRLLLTSNLLRFIRKKYFRYLLLSDFLQTLHNSHCHQLLPLLFHL